TAVPAFGGPWGISTNGGEKLDADYGRISAAPRFGTREVWTLINDRGGWDHPIHIHFEEGQILARNGSAANVPAWERGRKDVYRLHPDGSVTITLQFRDWGGMFMEHCHNMTHEDNAMLLRWEIDDAGGAFLAPLPTPITTPQGKTVRFYDDLVKGKIVAIDLIYTTCKYACPLETARLAQVQRLLGDRMGRDVFFYSITIDPDHDTPAVLAEYAEKYHAGPGWLFLTGAKGDIELIGRKLGLYTGPDPRNPDGHVPYLLVGNQATGQWMRNSAVDNPKF